MTFKHRSSRDHTSIDRVIKKALFSLLPEVVMTADGSAEFPRPTTNQSKHFEKGVYFALEKWVIQGFKSKSASHLISK